MSYRSLMLLLTLLAACERTSADEPCTPTDETCDGIDNDCDGKVDEYSAVGAQTWCADPDRNGYGAPWDTVTACDPPEGYVADCSECDNTDGTVHPNATEVCDGVDNNCNGKIDEGVTTTYYRDADSDGFGDANETKEGCEKPDGYVPYNNDCDDENADAFPGNAEVCDAIDNDCDGEIDEGLECDLDTGDTGGG